MTLFNIGFSVLLNKGFFKFHIFQTIHSGTKFGSLGQIFPICIRLFFAPIEFRSLGKSDWTPLK